MNDKIDNLFESALQIELDKLPYKKHADDGGYNDGQVVGFELGARWAKEFILKNHPEFLEYALNVFQKEVDEYTITHL